jgi:hypothetical protein
MIDYFECLHCGAFTPFRLTRPVCRECGCGTGIIRSMNPVEPAESPAENRKSQTGKPAGPTRGNQRAS